MKVIFTCGGTAGHVNPALALAGYMRKKDPTVEVLFVGTPEGIERDLVAQAGYDYRGIAVGSLERSVSWEAVRHNCKSAWEMLALRAQDGGHSQGVSCGSGGGHRRLRKLSHGKIRRPAGYPHGGTRGQYDPGADHKNAGKARLAHYGGL